MSRIAAWWQGLSPRERAMVAAMCAAIAAFVAWFGVLAPLRAARDEARQRHAEAVRAAAHVDAALARIAAIRAQRPPPPAADAWQAIVIDSAGAAGLGLERQEVLPDGALAIGIGGAAAPALFGWLDALRLEHAIAPDVVDIERRDGRLRASLRFPPP